MKCITAMCSLCNWVNLVWAIVMKSTKRVMVKITVGHCHMQDK